MTINSTRYRRICGQLIWKEQINVEDAPGMLVATCVYHSIARMHDPTETYLYSDELDPSHFLLVNFIQFSCKARCPP